MYTQIHTCAHLLVECYNAYLHASCIHTYIDKYVLTYKHKYIRTYIHTCIFVYIH